MDKSDRILIWVFSGLLLLFCLFLVWFVPARADLDFRLADISLSLETSYGRERKQQYEYDEVTAELPVVRAELEETQPLADAAAETVDQLKEERRRLRKEKEELLALLEAQNNADDSPVNQGTSLPSEDGSEGGDTHE